MDPNAVRIAMIDASNRFAARQSPAFMFQWLTYHSWVLSAQQAVYFSVPKNACTSLKRLMFRIEGRNIPPKVGDVHVGGAGKHLAFFPPDIIFRMLTAPSWFRFCIVRNPYSRLVSAYKSKIAKWDGTEDRFVAHREAMLRGLGYPEVDGRLMGNLSFRDFVRWVAADQSRWDDHWEMQKRILRTDVVSYSFVGKYESIEEDMKIIFARINVKPMGLERINVTPASMLAWFYDRELADIVYETYKPDFETFGYNRDSWMHE